MIKNYSSNIRKFHFFDTVKETNLTNINVSEESVKEVKENSKENNTELNQKDIDISINNITISNLGQMNTIDGILFINGRAIYKKGEKMIRENLIMKVKNNEIIDFYKMYFVHFNFSINIFEEQPYFTVIGSGVNEYKFEGKKDYFQLTSIKIYDANPFIKSETKIKPDKGIETGVEPYPKLLKKEIKILKRKSDQKLVCFNNEGDNLNEDYESFPNINAFSVDNSFTYIAVNIDKENIILIYGFPNLLECNIKDIKMIYLPKIENTKIEEIEIESITNLKFGVLKIKDELKQVLYTSTNYSIYYYI
jgi:hypothetical protein